MTRKREILESLESLFSVFFLFAPRGFRAKHNDGVCLSCSLFNIMFTTFLQSLIPFTLHDVFRVELNLSRFITMLALFVVMFTSGLQKCPNSTKIFGGHGNPNWSTNGQNSHVFSAFSPVKWQNLRWYSLVPENGNDFLRHVEILTKLIKGDSMGIDPYHFPILKIGQIEQ